jgi:hypothetical protein
VNLENSIKDVIAKKLEDGTVERVIAEELEKGIRKSLDDLFSYGGEAKKVIKEKIKSVMVPYLENYDYSEYILKLDTVLVEILKNTTLDNKKILENFKNLADYETIKEIKVSDLFDKWKDYVSKEIETSNLEIDYDGGVRYEYPEVTLEVEYDNDRSWSSFKYATVIFECEKDEEMNREIRISKFDRYDWTITSQSIHSISSLRHLDEFSIFLMNLAQSGTKIIIDVEYENDEVEVEAEPEPSFS